MALIEIDLGKSILNKEGYGRVRGYVLATQGARGAPDSLVARIRASSHYLFSDGKSDHRSYSHYCSETYRVGNGGPTGFESIFCLSTELG